MRNLLIVVVVGVTTLCGFVSAAEFSGVMVVKPFLARGAKQKSGTQRAIGRLYVKGSKVRCESTVGNQEQVLISRPDRGVTWQVRPGTKSYSKMRYVPGGVGPCYIPKEAVANNPQAKRAGTATLNGYVCDKYSLSGKVPVAPRGSAKIDVTTTVWISRKLNTALKIEVATDRGVSRQELTNIREKSQPDSLFDIPKGYREAPMPIYKPSPNRR